MKRVLIGFNYIKIWLFVTSPKELDCYPYNYIVHSFYTLKPVKWTLVSVAKTEFQIVWVSVKIKILKIMIYYYYILKLKIKSD